MLCYLFIYSKLCHLRMRNEGFNLSEFTPRKEVSLIYTSYLFLPFLYFLVLEIINLNLYFILVTIRELCQRSEVRTLR